ncbi:MAG: Lrp/AsnC family transcriptional regulator [Pseudomonadota bacterium]
MTIALDKKTTALDVVDRRILEALARDCRISLADLGRRVGLSPPGVSDRLRKLEDRGVIRGYSVDVDPSALGLGISAWLRIRPVPGKLHIVAALLAELPEIVECDRITGEDCFIAKAHVASVIDLERMIDRINPHAMTNTSIIQSSPVPRRLPAFADFGSRTAI